MTRPEPHLVRWPHRPYRWRRLVSPTGLVALLAVAVAAVAGCSPATTADTSRAASTTTGAPSQRTVTVLAAASLTEPLTVLARAYEQDHPGVSIRLSFGSSTTLAQQVAQGAPADVYASAGEEPLALLPAGIVQSAGRATIARNTIEIATPPDDPGEVSGLADLADTDLAVVLCARTVPCGRAADQVLAAAGVRAHVVSREIDVKATLAKVALGEADAAIVYHSDVVGADGAVRGVPIPGAADVMLTYPMLWLSRAPDAQGLVRFVAGPEGTRALESAGFLAP